MDREPPQPPPGSPTPGSPDDPDDGFRGGTPDWIDGAEWQRMCAERAAPAEASYRPPVHRMTKDLLRADQGAGTSVRSDE